MGALIVMKHAAEAFELSSVLDDEEVKVVEPTPTNPETEVIECLKTYRAIESAADEMEQNNFSTLRSILSRYVDRESAENFLSTCEVKEIEQSIPEGEIKRSKAGKIFVTKHLPGAYINAKAILLKAIENGIPFYDENGEPIGKSALQGKNTAAAKTPEEKIAAMMESVMKLLPKCSDPEAMRKTLQKIVA